LPVYAAQCDCLLISVQHLWRYHRGRKGGSQTTAWAEANCAEFGAVAEADGSHPWVSASLDTQKPSDNHRDTATVSTTARHAANCKFCFHLAEVLVGFFFFRCLCSITLLQQHCSTGCYHGFEADCFRVGKFLPKAV